MTTKVQRSLYRSLLREARALDANPVSKILWPLPKKLTEALNAPSALYCPGGPRYSDLVRRLFRTLPGREDLGFEALAKIKHHQNYIAPLLPRVNKDHAPLMEAFREEQLRSPVQRRARLVPVEAQTVELTIGRRIDGPPASTAAASSTATATTDGAAPASAAAAAPAADATAAAGSPSSERKFEKSKVVVRKEYPFELKVGMGLIAHPLSSSHVDRRVMMIVEKTAHTTTAVVLDMLYTYPLSPGNPMFPEVFWNHEVYNGGYVHVDYTMPPTANVCVLHTLEPPSAEGAPEPKNWLSWFKGSGANGDALPDAPPTVTPQEYHARLCKPMIKGKDGEPTLYYSQVEALPYLARLCPGHPRKSLRIYWGCMRWPTAQITADVVQGHWIPVELSASFFGAYPVKKSGAAPSAIVAEEDRFLTLEEMKARRELRRRVSGTDVMPPQTFPPHHPMCRRESLWDQVLFALGGEHAALVGTVNPFVDQMREGARQAVVHDPASLLDSLMPESDE